MLTASPPPPPATPPHAPATSGRHVRSPRQVSVKVRLRSVLDADQAFDRITGRHPRTVFTGFGPLPAVRDVMGIEGGWSQVGDRRKVELDNGSHAFERLTDWVRGKHYGFDIDGFSCGFRRLARSGRADWWFVPARQGGGCTVELRYGYEPQDQWQRVPLLFMVHGLWRFYLRQSLRRALGA